MTKSHGGKRKGAGRPSTKPLDKTTVNRSISIPRWINDLLVAEGPGQASGVIVKALLAYYAKKPEVKKYHGKTDRKIHDSSIPDRGSPKRS